MGDVIALDTLRHRWQREHLLQLEERACGPLQLVGPLQLPSFDRLAGIRHRELDETLALTSPLRRAKLDLVTGAFSQPFGHRGWIFQFGREQDPFWYLRRLAVEEKQEGFDQR